MSDLFADCAIPVAVEHFFTYRIPDGFRGAVCPGVRVIVPFGRRTAVGIVVRLTEEIPDTPVKLIRDVLDRTPMLPGELLRLAGWISDYYSTPPGEVLKAILVQGSVRPARRIISRLEIPFTLGDSEPGALSRSEKKVMAVLARVGHTSSTTLSRETGIRDLNSVLNGLEEKGMVSIREIVGAAGHTPRYERIVPIESAQMHVWQAWLDEPKHRMPRLVKQAAVLRTLLGLIGESAVPVTELLRRSGAPLSALNALLRKNIISVARREVSRTAPLDLPESLVGDQNIVLNGMQTAAVASITEAMKRNSFAAFLLHGVTGSGKTQVYIEAIRDAVAAGKSAIVLVPEISLTPQTVRRFTWHFGQRVAVLHSRMSISERYETWERARTGACSIVVGPRSAVFAPLPSLGLIVVDEEHEPSYKQYDQSPRYQARDVAVVRARMTDAVVVLGSATPSVESYANARTGKYSLLSLPSRIDGAAFPEISIVDMTSGRTRSSETPAASGHAPSEPSSLSLLLKEKITDRLSRHEGIILLQNRRGFSPFVECPACGYTERCGDCNITMTYHLSHRHLRCHYCGRVARPNDSCPDCGSPEIRYRGFGTQRVEQELAAMFPGFPVLRMDLDTTSTRGTHDRILREFSEGKSDILLGTQMVAKGLDFSRVTLVGVISADTQMLLPDFRSTERTFQLLTQVAGRAGRSTLAGEVVIQTRQPEHTSLRHVVTHDYASFFDEELAARRDLGYPPFSRLVLVEFRGAEEATVTRHAEAFGLLARSERRLWTMLGPAPAAMTKLRSQYRWHIVLKCSKEADPSGMLVHAGLQRMLAEYRRKNPGKARGVVLTVDVDPAGLM